jgi:D-galactarolactone cycloisomerase
MKLLEGRKVTMKIHEIRTAGLRGNTPKGGWQEEIIPEDCVHTLIAVHTDEGVVGLGSVYTSDALVNAALEVLRPLCIGENALEPERVSEKLHQNTFWQGRGGSITHTISGIDIALWDILGKVTQQPVARLLGGIYRDKVRPYASLLMEHPDALRERLEEIKARGFKAFKIGWGLFGRTDDSTMDERIVKTARETIGDDGFLMVDAGGSDAYWPHGYKWALAKAEMLADYGVTWFEEPLRPDDIENFVLLRRSAKVPIAGGETLTRRQSFKGFLERGAFDVVQPDVTKCGGISEQRRIVWMAQDYGVRYVGHGWNTAVGLATDLQLAAAFSDVPFVEYIYGSPYVDELVKGGWQLDTEGYLNIPQNPGLGVELDAEAVARLTPGAEALGI